MSKPTRPKVASAAADYAELAKAVLAYLSEIDNPSPPAYMHRKILRDQLRKLVGAPPQRE